MRTLALLIALGVAAVAEAQGLPTEPLTFGGGRVVLGAEATGTFAGDDPGFFNYTDYEYNALRNLRFGIAAEVRASQRVQVLGELRVDHYWGGPSEGASSSTQVQPYGLYVRIRPWLSQRIQIHAGRVPPTFGAFGRGAYGTSNMLIGYPLAYQYLISLRPDALPATAADLLRMRGRGWLSEFPLGNRTPDRGLPIVNAFRWDTGVQVHGVNQRIEWTGAVTTGSLSNPRVDDDNSGKQVAGRIVLHATPGFALGASAARGAFLNRTLAPVLPDGARVTDGIQQAVGVDGEYSAGRFLGRGEIISSRWTLPTGVSVEPLKAMSVLGEARYRILPGIHLAARAEHLAFSSIMSGARTASWEAPVTRVEAGASWSVIRNVTVKASWQRSLRDGGRIQRATLGAAQIVYWF